MKPKVILGSWPTPSDDWTEEHVLRNTESRAVNLVSNRTSSLQKLANRRADVVVFADAPLDSKSYFLSFGRVAPVQARAFRALTSLAFLISFLTWACGRHGLSPWRDGGALTSGSRVCM